MNKIILIILLAIITISYSQNNKYLSGNYSTGGFMWYHSYTFLDSKIFIERFSGCMSDNSLIGNYQIVNGKLILNYEKYINDTKFIFAEIDSTKNNTNKMELNIFCYDTTNNKPLNNIIAKVFASKMNKLITTDTSDYSGKINIKLSKNIQNYTLEASFLVDKNDFNYDYDFSHNFDLTSKFNYNIIIKTFKRNNTISKKKQEYKILNLDSNNLEIEELSNPNHVYKYSKN